MSAESKYELNIPNILTAADYEKNIQFGIVESNDDPQGMGRIKVRIPGPAQKGGDNDITTNDLAWSYPMLPKFFTSVPKVGEGVFVMILTKQKTHSDRLYFGPIISTQDKLNLDPITTTALSPFNFALLTPPPNVNRIPALKGVFPSNDDISIQGRYNTDLIFKKNEVVLRAGKFEQSTPNDNNPFPFQFNRTTQGYIQIRNDVQLNNTSSDDVGTVTNIVANKINLITHKDGYPRFNVTNQDDLLGNDEILKILETAHPLAFGDILIQYLKLLKNAFLNHVHNNNGLQPTDLVIGGATQDVREFKKNAEDLENRMLSKNIRIN
jgi:hypothetical protein